uniref:CD180 antigen n=1 Tax=Mus musculus TaxID=10090 RepID=E9PVS6_MOUSE
MAPDISCFFLVALFLASCRATTSSDQKCIEEYPVLILSHCTIKKPWKVSISEATIFPPLSSPKVSQQRS